MNDNTNANGTVENAAAKRGRGRPAGSNSFAHIQIKQLLTFLSEEATIPVSKVWMRETLGVITEAPRISVIKASESSIEVDNQTEEKVQFSLNTFEE